MHYDVRKRTLTLGKKPCPHCRQGKMPTAVRCGTCGGTGNGPRGGAGGCHSCKGHQVTWDYNNLTFCEVCLGAWQRAADETWDDPVPDLVITHVPITVARVAREEHHHARRGVLYSALDNGRALRLFNDDELIKEVRRTLLASPPKASAVTTGTSNDRRHVIDYIAVTATRTGYSVRPPGGLVTRPEPVGPEYLLPIGDPEPGVCDKCHLIHPGECF